MIWYEWLDETWAVFGLWMFLLNFVFRDKIGRFSLCIFNSTRWENNSRKHGDKWRIICAANKARWNAVETYKLLESQEAQSMSVCFKISGKENLRDASKALRKYAAN
jgi:hypothetical protein